MSVFPWSSYSSSRAGNALVLFLCHAVHASPLGWGHTVLTGGSYIANADGGPIAQSSDIWAAVIANVAPLLALVGERNAKEFLRVSSSWDQRLIMAVAPLGILSIMVCAIRLSGPRLLRRLIGRESERRSEALVELTPLSVAPASSVYTCQGVEIEPSEQQHRLAFVCAHIKRTTETFKALSAFKTLLTSRDGKASIDRDYEVVLGITRSNLSAHETVTLVASIMDENLDIDESLARGVKCTSLSFRMTGISPTQTASKTHTYTELLQLGNMLIGVSLFILMCGMQIAGYCYGGSRYDTASLQTLIMGLCGYCGIVIFTFALLVLIKAGVSIEPLPLPQIFDESRTIWTFSDAYHAEHRSFSVPLQRNLVLAAPAYVEGLGSKSKRELVTTFTCAGLVCSFVAYYLAVRVAQWWVPFSNLAIIWLAAAFRAILIKSFLIANEDEEDLREHWLGIFRDNVYDSLVATVETISPREMELSAASLNGHLPRAGVAPQLELDELGSGSCALVVAKPSRQSLKSWSGGEDVMKVGLEMAKNYCSAHTFAHAGHGLDIKKMPFFKRVLRFRLMIYVPGILWNANTDLDYVLTDEFDLPNLYRDIMKIIHLCANVRGTITRRTLTPQSLAEISNVLCGPVRVPKDDDLGDSITLRELLCYLRSLNPPSMKCYTLEQALLLPTIQLATMYESFYELLTPRIATYQNSFADKLRLSGAAYLGSLERAFEQHGIWDAFMMVKPVVEEEGIVRPRDETSGLYGRHIRQRHGMT